ncbi:hypothetical protein D3C80_1928270 [compost metagenome]
MKHVRQPHFMHVGQLTGGFARNVHPRCALAHQPIIFQTLERRITRNRQLVTLALHQFGKRELATVFAADYPAVYTQGVSRNG